MVECIHAPLQGSWLKNNAELEFEGQVPVGISMQRGPSFCNQRSSKPQDSSRESHHAKRLDVAGSFCSRNEGRAYAVDAGGMEAPGFDVRGQEG